jgi:hypothetical protein
MRTVMSWWHIQPYWQTKVKVNEHATKIKNVTLECVHQNGRKMIFSFENGKNIDNFIVRNEKIEKWYLMCQSAF